MLSSSNKKELRVVVTLGTGSFGASKGNQITMEGFRASVEVEVAGAQQWGTLRAQIYGVSQSDMNQITTLQYKAGTIIGNNKVDVYAIDGAQETLVFSGNIVNAWANYNSMPDVFLMIQAQMAYHAALTPVPPRSFKGPVDVASVMSQIVQGMGFTFENNGVTTQLSGVYLPGTGMDQALSLAQQAGVDLYLDNNVLAITPPDTPRGTLIPELSSGSGNVGYPTFDGVGVNFETLFNPSIRPGGAIKLTTSVKAINDISTQWIVRSLSHKLESEKPGGAWFTTVRGNLNGNLTAGQ
jgi:hypothetical protein